MICLVDGPRPRPGMRLDSMGSRRELADDEENKFRLIQENSGILCIGGTIYSGVKLENLQHMSDLGSGTCGTVTKYKLHSRTMAVKEMKRTDNKEESKRIFMDLEVIRRSNDCPNIVKCFGYIITMISFKNQPL